MLNNAETIEKLAKQLEQQKILNDFQKLVEKYEAICSKQN